MFSGHRCNIYTKGHLLIIATVLACQCCNNSSEFSTARTLNGEFSTTRTINGDWAGESKCLHEAAQAEEDDVSLLQLAISTYKDHQNNEVQQKMVPKEMDKSRQEILGQIEDYKYKDLKSASMYVGETAPKEAEKNFKGLGHPEDNNHSLLQLFAEHLHSLKRIREFWLLPLGSVAVFAGLALGKALRLAYVSHHHCHNTPPVAQHLPHASSDKFITHSGAIQQTMEDARQVRRKAHSREIEPALEDDRQLQFTSAVSKFTEEDKRGFSDADENAANSRQGASAGKEAQ